MLLLISLSEAELLLINAHFSYARAAHGMFCPLSYAQVTSLQPHLSVHYFNITIRRWTCTTLTTSEPGEQSVPGATQRGLYCARQRAASSNLNFCFVSFGFSCLYITSFSYSFFFSTIVLFFFFLINEGSTVIGQAVVVSLPNTFYVFMYKDCILVKGS